MKTIKSTKQIGDFGEDCAERHLIKRGWRIISRNFKASRGEIDIIGYRFGVLAYFEVKTRSNEQYGKPADAVTEEKIYRIKSAIQTFKDAYQKGGRIPVFYPFGIERSRRIYKERIDVIEVFITSETEVKGINHIKDWGNVL